MAPARCLGVAILGLPGLALAAPAAVLDLQSGAVGELTAKTLALAHGLLAFLLVLGVTVELLRGPGQRKRYLPVVWRTLLVLGLLQAYTFLAGSVVKQCTALGESLKSATPAASALDQYQAALAQSPTAGGQPAAGEDARPSEGGVFNIAVLVVVYIAEAITWVFTELSRILIAFFYAIGPLALVFLVLGLDAPGRWLRNLITVSCWPVVSSLLLHLSHSVMTAATLPTTPLGATFRGMATSLLLCVLALATPKIASALVGGVGNLLGEGTSVALGVAGGVFR